MLAVHYSRPHRMTVQSDSAGRIPLMFQEVRAGVVIVCRARLTRLHRWPCPARWHP